jgi:hypothetical protein
VASFFRPPPSSGRLQITRLTRDQFFVAGMPLVLDSASSSPWLAIRGSRFSSLFLPDSVSDQADTQAGLRLLVIPPSSENNNRSIRSDKE